jgi:putative transposase
MPRLARAVAVGCPHHITQRGNNLQDVFFVDADRRVYLNFLKEYADEFHLDVLGYCLMPNHIHLVATPNAEDSLAKSIGLTHFRYTQYINRLHKRVGHLWQGRFYSCALDDRHFWLAMRYIELNPVRARLCQIPWQYEWSSAPAHTRQNPVFPLLNLSHWFNMISAEQWRKELTDRIDDADLAKIRISTHSGRPLAADGFLSKLETLIGRRIRPLPPGRPRKYKKTRDILRFL